MQDGRSPSLDLIGDIPELGVLLPCPHVDTHPFDNFHYLATTLAAAMQQALSELLMDVTYSALEACADIKRARRP